MIKKTKSLLLKIKDHIFPKEWPILPYSQVNHEPTFLFIFTLPYSGSTALAKILNSGNSSMILNPNGEGQWSIPGLCKSDRWEPEKTIDWGSVKSVWMQKIQMVESLVGQVDWVIEKSPPNLVRSAELLEHFPKHEFIVFNRNPYANCASILYRNHKPESKSEDERIAILKELASSWATRSNYAKQIIERYNPIAFTYEEFCQDVESTIARIKERIPSLKGLSPDLRIKVKDYAPQKISDQNNRQIAKLSEKEKQSIAESLSEHKDLLDFFGYTNDWKKDISQGGASNIKQLQN